MSLYIGNNKVSSDHIPEFVDDLKKEVFDSIYPINYIYISTTANYPTIKLSDGTTYGSWTPLSENYMLRPAASSIGSTGGSATVKLTLANLPKHKHSYGDFKITGTLDGWYVSNNAQFKYFTGKIMSGTGTTKTYTEGIGDGVSGSSVDELDFDSNKGTWSGAIASYGVDSVTAHNNLPPYIKVMMYKRTA